MLMQPGVEMHAALEAIESVIAQDNDKGLIIGVAKNLPHNGISTAILVLHNPCKLGRDRPVAIRRVVRFSESPEKMLDTIRGVEKAVKKPVAEAVELVQHHRLSLVPGGGALLEK